MGTYFSIPFVCNKCGESRHEFQDSDVEIKRSKSKDTVPGTDLQVDGTIGVNLNCDCGGAFK